LSAAKAAAENLAYKATVVHALQPNDYTGRNNFCNWFLK
jgi:hypothetical protein